MNTTVPPHAEERMHCCEAVRVELSKQRLVFFLYSVLSDSDLDLRASTAAWVKLFVYLVLSLALRSLADPRLAQHPIRYCHCTRFGRGRHR